MVQGSNHRRGMSFFPYPNDADQFWGPPIPLITGYWCFGWGNVGGACC